MDKDTVGICVEACKNDTECYRDQMCCSNGCGHVCMDPVIMNGMTTALNLSSLQTALVQSKTMNGGVHEVT